MVTIDINRANNTVTIDGVEYVITNSARKGTHLELEPVVSAPAPAKAAPKGKK